MSGHFLNLCTQLAHQRYRVEDVAEEPKGRNREFQSMHFLGLGKKPLYLYEHNVTANLMRKEVSEDKKRKARKILMLEHLYTQQ